MGRHSSESAARSAIHVDNDQWSGNDNHVHFDHDHGSDIDNVEHNYIINHDQHNHQFDHNNDGGPHFVDDQYVHFDVDNNNDGSSDDDFQQHDDQYKLDDHIRCAANDDYGYRGSAHHAAPGDNDSGAAGHDNHYQHDVASAADHHVEHFFDIIHIHQFDIDEQHFNHVHVDNQHQFHNHLIHDHHDTRCARPAGAGRPGTVALIRRQVDDETDNWDGNVS